MATSISPDGSCRINVNFPNGFGADPSVLAVLKDKGYKIVVDDFTDPDILNIVFQSDVGAAGYEFAAYIFETLTLGFPPAIAARSQIRPNLIEAVKDLPSCR
jgi:hypothetical protein